MPLAVLLDTVGQIAQTPILGLGNLAALFFDQGFDILDQRLGLGRREVRTSDEDVLVVSHWLPSLWIAAPWNRRVGFRSGGSSPA